MKEKTTKVMFNNQLGVQRIAIDNEIPEKVKELINIFGTNNSANPVHEKETTENR